MMENVNRFTRTTPTPIPLKDSRQKTIERAKFEVDHRYDFEKKTLMSLPLTRCLLPCEIFVPSIFEVRSNRSRGITYREEPIELIRYGNITVGISGDVLDTDHESVLIALTQLKLKSGSDEFPVSYYGLLKLLGLSTHSQKTIKRQLRQLRRATIEIQDNKNNFAMIGLISYVVKSDKRLWVKFDPFFERIYWSKSVIWFDPRFRLSLKGKGSVIAKRLYMFCQRHRSAGNKHPKFPLDRLCQLIGLDRDRLIGLVDSDDKRKSVRFKRIREGLRLLEAQGYLKPSKFKEGEYDDVIEMEIA